MKKLSLLIITFFSSLCICAQDESEERGNYLLKRIGMSNRFELCWLNDVDYDPFYTVIFEFEVPSVKVNEKVDFQLVLPSENSLSGFMNFFSYDSLSTAKKVEVGFGVIYFSNTHDIWQFNNSCFDRTKIEAGFQLNAFLGPCVQVVYPRTEQKYFILNWNARADEKHFDTAYESRNYTLLEDYKPVLNHEKRERGDLINYNSAAGIFELQKRNASKEIESSQSNLLVVADRIQKQMTENGWSGLVSTPGKAENENSFSYISPPTEGVIEQISLLIPAFAYNQEKLLYYVFPTNSDLFKPILYQSDLVESIDGINVYTLTIGYNAEVKYVSPFPNLQLPTNYIIVQAAKYYQANTRLDNITGGWEKTDTYKFLYHAGSVKRNTSLLKYMLHEEGKSISLSLEDHEFHTRYNCVGRGYRFIDDFTIDQLSESWVSLSRDTDKFMLITVVSECDSIPLRLILPNGSYYSPKWSLIDEHDPTVHGALIDVDFNELRFFLTNEFICKEMFIDVYACGSDEERAVEQGQPRETFETVMKDLFWLCNGNVNCLRDILISAKSDHKIYACRKPCSEAEVYYVQKEEDELYFSFYPKDELNARAEFAGVVQSVLKFTPSQGKFVEIPSNTDSQWSFLYEGTDGGFAGMKIEVSLESEVQLDSKELKSTYFVQVVVSKVK